MRRCVRCDNVLGDDDYFEDGETRPYVQKYRDNDDEPYSVLNPLCIRCFRIESGLGVWHDCPTCGGKGKVREPGT